MYNKLKILQIANPYNALNHNMKSGGVERVIYHLDREFTELGHDSHVVAPGNSELYGTLHPSPDTNKPELYGTTKDNDSRKIRGEFENHARRTLEYIEKINPDLVHDHTGRFIASEAYRTVRDDMTFQLLTTLHNPVDRKEWKINSYVNRSEKEFFNTVSNASRMQYSLIVDVDEAIHNGVDVENYPFTAQKDGYLFSLGRIHPVKGQHDAISVARALNKRLVIGGSILEIHQDYYKSFIEPFVDGKQIKYVGELGEDKKKEYFARASAFLMPIQWEEPFGLVMIEAMATGTPVIAYNVGAIPEVVNDGETGFVVNGLEEMIRMTDSANLINPKDCREHVEKKFSTKGQALAYLSLYNRLLKKVEHRETEQHPQYA